MTYHKMETQGDRPKPALSKTAAVIAVMLLVCATVWADDEPVVLPTETPPEASEGTSTQPIRRRPGYLRDTAGDRSSRRRPSSETATTQPASDAATTQPAAEDDRSHATTAPAETQSVPTATSLPRTRERTGEATEAGEPEAVFRFQFEQMPYTTIVERFAKAVDKPLIGDLNVPGELTFFDSQPYTYEEAMDTLNVLLRMRGYTLMEQGRFLRLVRLSDVQRMSLPIHQGLEGTEDYRPGRIVTVVLPLKFLEAETAANAVRPMVSEFGNVQPLARGKGVLVTDQIETVRQIRHLLNEIDTETLVERQVRTYQLSHASAGSVAGIINDLFGGGDQQGRPRRPDEGPAAGATITATADTRTNSVILTGAGDQIEMAEGLIERLDTSQTTVAGDLRIFKVSHGRAGEIAQALNELLRTPPQQQRGRPNEQQAQPEPTRVVGDDATNSVIVSAPVDQMPSIEQLIRDLDEPPTESGRMRTFPLENAEAQSLVSVLSNALRQRDAQGRMTTTATVSADQRTNTLIVSGSGADITAAADLIRELDRPSEEEAFPREVHVVRLKAGDAYMVSRSLMQLFREDARRRGGQGDIRVEAERQTNSLIISALPEDWPKIKEILDELEATSDEGTQQVSRVIPLEHADANELAGALSRTFAYRRDPRDPYSQVSISAVRGGNSLIVSASSEDMEEIAEMVEFLDVAEQTGTTEVRTYVLEGTDVGEAARSLSRLFARDYRSPATGEPEPRFESDAAGDRLMVSATAEQFEKIEKLIEELQTGGETAEQTKTFKLQHADAGEIADVLRQMLSESPTGYGWRYGATGGDEVRVTAIESSNSVVVQASPTKMTMAEELVATFDTPEMEGASEIRVIALEHAQAEDLASTLREMMPRDRMGRQNVYVQADALTNSVLIRAPASQRRMLEDMISKLDTATQTQAREMRIIPLKYGSASALADMLRQLYSDQQQQPSYGWWRQPQQRDEQADRVIITAAPHDKALIIEAPRSRIEEVAELVASLDTEQASGDMTVRTYQLSEGSDARQLAWSLQRLFRQQNRDIQGEPEPRFEGDSSSNTLLVSATSSQFERIDELVEDLQAETQVDKETRTYTLQHARAEELIEVLRPLLGAQQRYYWWQQSSGDEVQLAALESSNTLVVQGPSEKLALADELIKQFDTAEAGGRSGIRIVELKNAEADSLVRAVREVMGQRTRGAAGVTITAEDNSNSVLVRGPSNELEEVVGMIRELDGESTSEPVEVRVYPLENGDAETLAETVRTMFEEMVREAGSRREAPPLTVSADTRTNSLVVSTTEAHFALIEQLLDALDQAPERPLRQAEYIWLENADAWDVSDKLKAMFEDRRGADKPVIEADFYTNALTIIAREEDVKAMKQVIEQLDSAARDSNVSVRVIPVSQGRAAEVARQIQRIYGQMTDSHIIITDRLPRRDREDDGGAAEEPESNSNDNPAPSNNPHPANNPGDTSAAENESNPSAAVAAENSPPDSSGEQTASDQASPDDQPENGESDSSPRIAIAVDEGSNMLIVSGMSQDIDSIEDILWQLMLRAETAEAEYRFFKVEKADPVMVAQTLDELFNPRPTAPQQQQQQRQDRQDRNGEEDRRQPSAPIPASPPNITVVPDVRTRSVIVRAKPDYFEMIGEIIEQLDRVPTLVSEVRVFALKNTDAEEVAGNLRELFRLSAADDPGRGTPQQQRAQSIRQMIEVRRDDGETQVDIATMVSVSANTETNSVVVAAPAEAMEVLADIIRELDQSAAESTVPVVRMYPLEHAEVDTTVSALREIFVEGAAGQRGAQARRRQETPVVITGDRAGGQVIVSAPADRHELIARTIEEIDTASTGEQVVVRVYRIRNAEARGLAAALGNTLSGEGGRGGSDGELRISADESSNSVVVRAREGDHEHIAGLIEQMDVTPVEELPVQIIELQNADPENVARVLNRVFGAEDADRGTPGAERVRIEPDVDGGMIMVRAEEQTFEEIRRLAARLDAAGPVGRADQTVLSLEHADAESVASSLQQAFEPKRGEPTRPDDLVTVVAEPYSNALIVTANERNLERIKSLLETLDTPEAGGARTELLLLSNARATELAEVLSRVAPDADGRGPEVVISADNSSNALVMSGPSAKLDELMRMAMQLDQASTSSKPGVYVIPLESGDAAGVAASIRDLYQQQVQAARRGGTEVEPLAVSPDTRANAIVLVAGESMYEQVSAWVEQVEQMKPARGPLRVIRLEHADPQEVKDAIDAIYDTGSGSAQPAGRRGRNPGNPSGSSGSGVEVTVMEKQRSLLVGASDEEFEEIQELVAELDAAARGARKQVKLFHLEHATNTLVADALNQMYRAAARPNVPEDEVLVTPLRQTQAVVVTATEEKLEEVAHFIEELDQPEVSPQLEFRIYRLTHARPEKVLPMLRQMLQQVVEASAMENLHVEADERTRSIIVTAREPLFEQVAKIIEALDQAPEYETAEVAIILLKEASAEALAEVLNDMLRPASEGQVTPEARALQEQVRRLRIRAAMAEDIPELDLTKPIKIEADPAQTGANALLISSTPDNIRAMREVVAVLDRVPVAEGVRVRLMHLTSADAESVAEILREIFEQGEQLAGRPGTAAEGRGEPESMTGKALTHALNISADVRTNTLVLAGVEESLALAELIVKDLDRQQGRIVTEVRLFKLEHAEAARLAPILTGVFGEGTGEPETEGLRTHVTRLRTVLSERQGHATTRPKQRETLVIEADETTNILVVAAREDVMPLIADVIGTMDVPGAGSLSMVRVFPLENADVARMSELIDTLYSGPNAELMRDEDRPTVAVDTRTNSLVVWANEKTFGVIESLLKRLDSEEIPPLAGMRVFAVEHADAVRLAEMLEDFFDSKRSAELEITPDAELMPVVVVPDPRANVLMVAGSREHFAAVEAMLEKLDRPDVPPAGEFRVFALRHATAGGLAPMLRELFEERTVRGDQREPVTIVADAARNALVVGAESSDMKLVESLVARLDVAPEAPGQETKIFPLKQANVTQVAETVRELYEAQGGLSEAGVAVSMDERTNALIVSGGPADIQRVTEIVSRLDTDSVTRVAEIRVFTLQYAQAAELAELLTTALTEKPQSPVGEGTNRQWLLRFVTSSSDGRELVASALQEGVLITADERTNSLLVSAPLENMTLLERLITALDSTSPRMGEIRVFKLVNADAAQMADVLRQLFRLEGDTENGRSVRYTLRTAEGESAEPASATLGTAEQDALTVTVDLRTNSLLVGGTEHYVDLAAEVIQELDATPAQDRTTRVYRLRNAQGEDIEAALRDFLDQERDRLVQALGEDRMGAAQQLLEREVAIVAEENTNTLLLSASPRYFETIERMIEELDKAPPQVLIQVLLAEVTLDDTSELGIDWNYNENIEGTNVSGGTDFSVEAGIAQFGGLSLSVTGGDINFFLRALQSQGRIEVLSRPQVLAADNQEARINIGQRVPFITNSRVTEEGTTLNTIQYEPVGINLDVLPRINDDGFVKLQVAPEISSIATSTVQISEGVNAIIVNSRSAETTVTVQDGHTIIIGGLITSSDENREEKVPVLGDIPYMGNLFKSTSLVKQRRELLIVLTPHVLRTSADADEITGQHLDRLQRQHERIGQDMEYDTMYQLERSSPRRIDSEHWDRYLPVRESDDESGRQSPVRSDRPEPKEPESDEPQEQQGRRRPEGPVIRRVVPLDGLVPEEDDED
ncbi:MAG: secretin N-terminal domain-containing protein [Phycisphaerae bacterium]